MPIWAIAVQSKDQISYNEIVDVRLKYGYFDSKKNRYYSVHNARSLPSEYFEFIFDENRTKLMLISGFTPKQKQKMLNIIGEKTGIYKDYQQLRIELTERQSKWKT